jgi:NAD(P)-dependent dehydrogenase (short-subunit alcohol dehydrogenase family)
VSNDETSSTDERLRRFVVRAKLAPFAEFSVPELGRFPLYLNKDRYGLADNLSMKLQEKGLEAIVTEEIPSTARHVMYIGVADEHIDADQLYEINYAAFATARNISASMEKHGGIFWTIQSTGGDFGLSSKPGNQVGTAGLAALAKTAIKEWPQAHIKAIDVDLNISAAVISDHICKELFHGGLEKEVGFMEDGTRITIGLEISNQRPFAMNVLAPYDTLLVSGGARGVTAHSLIALARKQPLRFIILGRSARPGAYRDVGIGNESEQELTKLLYEHALAEGKALSPMELKKQVRAHAASREIRYTMDQLEQLGSEVCYVPVDITNNQALVTAIMPVKEKWGVIRGIIHGAGILADKRIIDKQDEQFNQVFSTKVKGFQAMLAAVNTDDLKLIVIFSSVAAREGNIGQCDYAMANEVLNKMAHQLQNNNKHNNRNIVVKSLNWGPWEGGMVTPALKQHFLSQGISLIPTATGAELFAEEAGMMNLDEVEIVIGGTTTPSFITNQERTWKLEKVLDLKQHSWLDDHQIHGYRVVPIIMVHEWFCQLAQSAYPDLVIIRIEKLRVLKGVRIHPTSPSPVTLIVTGKECYDSEQQLIYMDIQLADSEGTCHYAAHAILGNSTISQKEFEAVQQLVKFDKFSSQFEGIKRMPLKAWVLESSQIYGDRLFHGPSFQVIGQLQSYNAECAVGMLQGKSDITQNEGSSLHTFPSLLDGGLQLARLWGYEIYGQPSLPMSIGNSYVASRQVDLEPIRCEILVKQQNSQKFVVDINWINQHDRCLAQLQQVEMYVIKERRPS